MSEEIQMALDVAREAMDKAIKHMESELTKVRAGKAHPADVRQREGGLLWSDDTIEPSSQREFNRRTNLDGAGVGKVHA